MVGRTFAGFAALATMAFLGAALLGAAAFLTSGSGSAPAS